MAITRLKPTQTLNGGILDARVTKLQGRELHELINRSIEFQSKWNVSTLPDRLIVTQKQFASLNNYTEEMYDTADRMYRTNWNVMEVHIDRENVDNVTEINDIIEGVEELERLEKEAEDE